jgi:hypothetical protein
MRLDGVSCLGEFSLISVPMSMLVVGTISVVVSMVMSVVSVVVFVFRSMITSLWH